MLSEKVEKIIFEIMKNLHESGYLSPKSITYVAETLQDMGIDFDYNELEDLFDRYLDIIALGMTEKKEKEHVNKDAGDVEFNISMFNKGFAGTGAQASGSGEASVGCAEGQEHPYLSNSDTLLEGGFNYLLDQERSRKISARDIISKLFSEKIFSELFWDSNLNSKEVINAGDHYPVKTVDIDKENQSMPKPGFSIISNPWSSKVDETHDDTHHIYFFHQGGMSEFKAQIPHDVHTKLHNNLRTTFKNMFFDDSEQGKINTDLLKQLNHNIVIIKQKYDQDKEAVVYTNKTGLILREFEWYLREFAIRNKNLPSIRERVMTIEAEELVDAIKTSGSTPVFNSLSKNGEDLLKIKDRNGNLYDFIPFVVLNDYNLGKANTPANLFKATKTNGWTVQLPLTRDDDRFVVCALVKISPDNVILLKNINEINNFDANAYKPEEKTEDLHLFEDDEIIVDKAEEDKKEKPLTLSSSDLRNILFNNFIYYVKRFGHRPYDGNKLISSSYGDSSSENGIINSIWNRLDQDGKALGQSYGDSWEKDRQFNAKCSRVISEWVDYFLDNYGNYSITILNPSKYHLDSQNGNILIRIPLSDVKFRDEDASKDLIADSTLNLDANNQFTYILSTVINKKLTDPNKFTDLLLDIDGKPVVGIYIEDNKLKSTPQADFSRIYCINIENAEKDPHTLELISRSGMDIFSTHYSRMTGLQKIIWSKKLNPCRYGLFRSCPAEVYENVFSSPLFTAVGGQEFSYSNIKEAILAPYTKNIGSEAFYGCHRLQSVFIPKGTYINQQAFGNCGSVTVYFESSKQNVKAAPKWGRTGVKSVKYDSSYAEASGDEVIVLESFNDRLVEEFEQDGNLIYLLGTDSSNAACYLLDVETLDKKFPFIKNNNSELYFCMEKAIKEKRYLDNQIIIIGSDVYALRHRPEFGQWDWSISHLESVKEDGKKKAVFKQWLVLNAFSDNLLNAFADIYSNNFVAEEGKLKPIQNLPGIDATDSGDTESSGYRGSFLYSAKDIWGLVYEKQKIDEANIPDDLYIYFTLDSLVKSFRWFPYGMRDTIGIDFATIKTAAQMSDRSSFIYSDISLGSFGSEKDFVEKISGLKLSKECVDLLAEKGLSESDFNSIISDPGLNIEIYGIAYNAYQKTIIDVFKQKVKNDIYDVFKKYDLDLDLDRKIIGIKLVDFCSAVMVGETSSLAKARFMDIISSWILKLQADNDADYKKHRVFYADSPLTEIWDEDSALIGDRCSQFGYRVIGKAISEAANQLKNKVYSPSYWSSSFNKNLEKNLKTL